MIIESPILSKISSGYVLKKPLTISVTKQVIDTMKSKYIPNGETGGLMWLRATSQKTAVIENITFLPNVSGLATGYATNKALFNATINSILAANYLPVVFHTHPTNLGLNLYDSRKQNFYLRASAPDRRLSTDTINDTVPLFMPEVIFVSDSRYDGGYSMAFYGGKILPTGFSRLSPLQFFAAGLGLYAFLNDELDETLFLAVAGVMIYEETLRPKYEVLKDGSYLVKF